MDGLFHVHIFDPITTCNFNNNNMLKGSNRLAVLGEGGIRITCDFGTGIAGVLRTLNRIITCKLDDLMLDEETSKKC